MPMTNGNLRQNARKFKGPWFRLYTADIDNYHIQRLPPAVKWTWVELCAIAAETGGVLPDHEQISYRLREDELHIVAAIDVLISAGMLEQSCLPGNAPILRIVGWNERQFVADKSALRMRKLRSRKRPVTASDDGCDVTCDRHSDDKTVILSSTSRKGSNRASQDFDVDGRAEANFAGMAGLHEAGHRSGGNSARRTRDGGDA